MRVLGRPVAKRLRRILVAIRDVRRAPQSELRKAGALARASGAAIELFHALAERDLDASRQETLEDTATRARQRLERFARHKALRGVVVSCTTAWDYPAHEAIVRRAIASRADLVIAATHPHRFGGRLLLRNTDWELIRHCPLPLLLVKSRREYAKPVILAAVDPFHAHARPADLDARLLATGNTMARLLRGRLHIFHAYMPLIFVPAVPLGTAPLVAPPAEAEDAHGRWIARAIDRLAESAGVPRTRRHVQMGDVSGELRAAARQTRAKLVVMGAVSRSALVRLLIGNTAERVLDRLDCDVLVVKPRRFKTGVVRRKSAPRPPSRHATLLSVAVWH
jgi:universal stress protein E